MIVNSSYRNYLRCNAFVNAHIDYTKTYEKEDPESARKICSHFLNHLYRFKIYYRKLKDKAKENDEYVYFKFYEGKEYVFYYYIENPSYSRNEDGKLMFDHKRIKIRIRDYIYKTLSEAEKCFDDKAYSMGAYYMGRYFGCKELLRLLSLYIESGITEVLF